MNFPNGVPQSIGAESMYNEDEDAKQSLLRDDHAFHYESPIANTNLAQPTSGNDAPLLKLRESVDVDVNDINDMLSSSPNEIGIIANNHHNPNGQQARLLKLSTIDTDDDPFKNYSNNNNNNNHNPNINQSQNQAFSNTSLQNRNRSNNANDQNRNRSNMGDLGNEQVLIKTSSDPSKRNNNNNNNRNNNMNINNNRMNNNMIQSKAGSNGNSGSKSKHQASASNISNKSYPAPPHNKKKHWRCGICTFAENSMDTPVCKVCGALPPKDDSGGNNNGNGNGNNGNGNGNNNGAKNQHVPSKSELYDRNQSVSGAGRGDMLRYNSSFADLMHKVGIDRPQTPPAAHRASKNEKHHYFDENQASPWFSQPNGHGKNNSSTSPRQMQNYNDNNDSVLVNGSTHVQQVRSDEINGIRSLFQPTKYQQGSNNNRSKNNNNSNQHQSQLSAQLQRQQQQQQTTQALASGGGANSQNLGNRLFKRQQSVHTRSRSANYNNQVTDISTFVYTDNPWKNKGKDDEKQNNSNNSNGNNKNKNGGNSPDNVTIDRQSTLSPLQVPTAEDAKMNRVSITNHDLPISEKNAIHTQLLALTTKKDLQIELYSVKMTLQKKVKEHEAKIKKSALQLEAMRKQYEIQKIEWKKYACYDLLELCEKFYSKFFSLKERESEIEQLYINCLEMKMNKLQNAYQKLEKHMLHWDIADVREYIKSALYTVFRIRISSEVSVKKKENIALTKEIKKLQSEYAKQKAVLGQKEVKEEVRKEEIQLWFNHAVIDQYNARNKNFVLTYRYFLDPSLQKRFNSFLRDERVDCGKILASWVGKIDQSVTLNKEIVLKDVYIFVERMVNTFIAHYGLQDTGKYTYSEYVARFVYPSILCIPLIEQCISSILRTEAGLKEMESFSQSAEHQLFCKLLTQKLN